MSEGREGVVCRPLLEQTLADGYDVWQRSLHGRRLTIDGFRRKYDTGYLGVEGLAHVGYVDGRPAGFYGAMAMPLLCEGERLVGVQICDFATLSEFRRRGVHGSLRRAVLAACAEQGVEPFFALHTDVSLRASGALQWQAEQQLEAVLLHRARSLAGLLRRLSWGRRLHRRRAERLLSSLEAPLDEVLELAPRHASSLGVEYSERYFRHRSYTTNGWIRLAPELVAWVSVDANLRVGALLGAPTEEHAREALRGLENLRRKLSLGWAHHQAPTADPWVAALARASGRQPVAGFLAMARWIRSQGRGLPRIDFRLADYDTF